MTWRFIDSGYHTGEFNMLYDVSLANQIVKEGGNPVLRFYGWQPSAISLGANQQETDFDRAKLSSAGIDIVKRPTGGRAILHANELTYSVVIPLGTMGPRQMYRFINEGLLRGLENLGIHATLTDIDDNFSRFYKDPASVPCFASSAKSEIKFEGKKMVGSAQRRYGNVILQHGSLLLGPEHLRIAEFLAPHILNVRDAIEENLLNHTIDAKSILGREVSFDEAADAVQRGFESAHGISFEAMNEDFSPAPQIYA